MKHQNDFIYCQPPRGQSRYIFTSYISILSEAGPTIDRFALTERKKTSVATYIIGSGFDLSIEPVLVLVPKWGITHEEDVKDHSARPYIDGFAVGFLFQNFGR